jgi:hypothetical protein
MDRNIYRPTAAQREWLRRTYPTCVSPTCTIATEDSDIDHTKAWQFQWPTNIDNLAPLSRGHHTLKHKTKITVIRTPAGRFRWATPTGYTRDDEPPPF